MDLVLINCLGMIDGRKAALEFLDSMEKCMKDNGICAKCANLAHDGDCKKVEEAAGNEKAMEKIRELLSSDHVSSDEEMGAADEPSSSTSREHWAGEQKGKEIIEMCSYTINLVEMAELHCGGVDLTFNPCRDHRTFKTTLERGCDTIPCYIPRFGDVSDVDMPWAYASMTDPKFFPKGAILEQIDVQQLGKSINFCMYPFDDVPFAKLVMNIPCSDRETRLTSYLMIFAGTSDTRSAIAEEVLSSVTKVGGSILTQYSTTDRRTCFHRELREQDDTWVSWR